MASLKIVTAATLLCSGAQAELQRVYIGTSNSKGIYFADLDSETGTLSIPQLAVEAKGCGFVAIHPNQKWLYSAETKALYGTKSKFGQGCLLARRLIEHGVRCVEVTKGGWDSHNEMPEEKARDLDRALAALMSDLQQRGLLESTIVVVATEFGRNPEIKEDSLGRDHWAKAFSTVIGGGGIKTGQVIGATDRGHEVTEDKVLVPDLHATIGTLMGMPIKEVVMSDSGRPFNVGYKGQPIQALI